MSSTSTISEPGAVGTKAGVEPDTSVGPSRQGYADFFARTAHDLRSPLGVVLHVLRQLGTDLEPHLREEHRTLLNLGGRGARRMQGFIDRIALLAELESEKVRPVLERADVRETITATIASSEATEPRSEIQIGYEPPPSPVPANVDLRLFRFALAELLRNAVAHAKKRVRITVSAEKDTTSVSVEDDGEGVSEAVRDTLFSRFVVREARGGLGIGLSIARDLTLLQLGSLSVSDSTLPPAKPGTVGARFVLSLPGGSAQATKAGGPR